MKKIPFIKMHGAGNDFVIVDCRIQDFRFSTEQVHAMCNRHKGIGCDQFVLIKNSAVADCRVEFYNSDGSRSGTCGNATRCVAHLVGSEKKIGDIITIETDAGILECRKSGDMQYTVNMGAAKYGWQDIPLAQDMDTLSIILDEGAGLGAATAVSMGNPHAVFFVDDVQSVQLEKYGLVLEHHPIFPQRANIGIARVLSKNEVNLRVWERGAGETLACGSGACAAVAAGIRRNLLADKVKVNLPGGTLYIEVLPGHEVMMTGPVAVVFRGWWLS